MAITMGSNGGSLAVSHPRKGDIMSHYGAALAQVKKILAYYANSGLNMRVIACAEETIKTFEDKKGIAQKLIPGFKKDLDEAKNARAVWLKEQLDCPSKMAQLFADMEKGEHPENFEEIAELEETIKRYSEDLEETPVVLAAQRLIKQFEKFRENPQLPLEFGELQQEYKNSRFSKMCIDDGYDYF